MRRPFRRYAGSLSGNFIAPAPNVKISGKPQVGLFKKAVNTPTLESESKKILMIPQGLLKGSSFRQIPVGQIPEQVCGNIVFTYAGERAEPRVAVHLVDDKPVVAEKQVDPGELHTQSRGGSFG